jgi:hypothetical protein
VITSICVTVNLCEIVITELHSCSVRIGGDRARARRASDSCARARPDQFLMGGCFVPLRLRTRLGGTGWGRVRADAFAESVRCHRSGASTVWGCLARVGAMGALGSAIMRMAACTWRWAHMEKDREAAVDAITTWFSSMVDTVSARTW